MSASSRHAVGNGSARPAVAAPPQLPRLGLVCITVGPAVRYRTITRTRLLSLDEETRAANLDELYRHNLQVLFGAMDYCRAHNIQLYRVTSNLFPQIDHPSAEPALRRLHDAMARFATYPQQDGVRVVLHPDQFAVLNSESPAVVANSLAIMRDHARIFDLLKLPQTSWSAMILHGGKIGRGE